tara:strand:- start:2739 stop:3383 length:645 start_codon:yes stop_codon:yes gene_type:complete
MKIIHNDTPFFNISLENVFSDEELKIIFKEINELKPHFKEPDLTASASTHSEFLKKNTGMFLLDSENYKILKTTKIIDKCIKLIGTDKSWKNNAFKRLFNSLMWGGELLNCYGKNDYYKPHTDEGIFSLIFFLWEKTSNFEGGDLFFPEYDYLHKCISNCGILFFSTEIHGVTPIEINDEKSTRYSIVVFSEKNFENVTSIKRNIISSNSILYQ